MLVGPTGLPGPSRSSSLTRQERSLVGVARWPGEYNRETDPDQQLYGRSFWRATRAAGLRISAGRINSFRGLWSYARHWRRTIAGSGDCGFDTERAPGHEGMFTPLKGVYEYIRDQYATRTDGVIEASVVPAVPPSRRFRMEDEIDGRPIALTSIVMSTDPMADRESQLFGILRDAGLSVICAPFHIDHTAPSDVPRIRAHAESLYSRALDPSVSNAEALTTLGELHWWVAHAMPDDRGSAAKAELAVRSMAQARGMDLPPFEKGFVPDLEAMTTPRSAFVEKYPARFDWKSGSGQSVE